MMDHDEKKEKAEKLINPDAARKAMSNEATQDVVNAISQQQNVSAINMADLRDLVNVGKITHEERILNYVFNFNTLNSEEVTEAFAAVDLVPNASDLTKFNVLAIQLLARAVVSVNGHPLESLCQNEKADTLERRLIVVKSWQQTLLNKLFDIYSNLAERGQSLIAEESKKDSEAVKN